MAVCLGGFAIYAQDYYRADETAAKAMETTSAVNVYTQDNVVVFRPQNPVAGFVFYPGGKVEHTAYAPLMKQLAENDILCLITEMPFNLAVFDMDAAQPAMEMFADIENWYIGGHSLGGAMAAGFAAENSGDISGLVLLAAYSTADLTATDIDVLSVYGGNDKVLNMEKYDQYHTNLPQDTQEIVISGGNHAQFGSYGPQDGDGTATITAENQLTQTADAIIDMIK